MSAGKVEEAIADLSQALSTLCSSRLWAPEGAPEGRLQRGRCQGCTSPQGWPDGPWVCPAGGTATSGARGMRAALTQWPPEPHKKLEAAGVATRMNILDVGLLGRVDAPGVGGGKLAQMCLRTADSWTLG